MPLLLLLLLLLVLLSPGIEGGFAGVLSNGSVFSPDRLPGGSWHASLASLRSLDSAKLLYELPANSTLRQLDRIQYAQFKEGIFVPSSRGDSSDRLGRPARMFASKEAAACLRGRKIRITGDLQMVLLYIGLADILLGVPSAFEMRSTKTILQMLQRYDRKLRDAGKSRGLDVRYMHQECLDKEIACYTARLLDDDEVADALVVGFARNTEQLRAHPGSFDAFERHLQQLLAGRQKNALLVLTDAFSLQAKRREGENGAIARLNNIASSVARSAGRPILDFFSVTKQCVWRNCTVFDGFRSRFVQRFKAQMLLDLLCR